MLSVIRKPVFVLLSCFAVFVNVTAKNVFADDFAVDNLNFSPNGKNIVVRGGNVFDSQQKQESAIFDSKSYIIKKKFPLYNLIFSPDSSYFVGSGSPMNMLDLSGKTIRSFPSFGYVSPMVISPDGEILIGQGESSYVGLWKLKKGNLISKFNGGNNFYGPIYFSPDSRSVYAMSEGSPALFSIVNKDEGIYFKKMESVLKITHPIVDYDVNFNRKLMCVVSTDQVQDAVRAVAQIHIVEFSGKTLSSVAKTVYTPGGNSYIDVAARFSHDGRYVAIRSSEEIIVCSSSKLQILRRYKPASFGLKTFNAIDFSPIDNRLAFGGWGKFAPFVISLP